MEIRVSSIFNDMFEVFQSLFFAFLLLLLLLLLLLPIEAYKLDS